LGIGWYFSIYSASGLTILQEAYCRLPSYFAVNATSRYPLWETRFFGKRATLRKFRTINISGRLYSVQEAPMATGERFE